MVLRASCTWPACASPGELDLNSEAGAAAEPELDAMMRSFQVVTALAEELAS